MYRIHEHLYGMLQSWKTGSKVKKGATKNKGQPEDVAPVCAKDLLKIYARLRDVCDESEKELKDAIAYSFRIMRETNVMKQM